MGLGPSALGLALMSCCFDATKVARADLVPSPPSEAVQAACATGVYPTRIVERQETGGEDTVNNATAGCGREKLSTEAERAPQATSWASSPRLPYPYPYPYSRP